MKLINAVLALLFVAIPFYGYAQKEAPVGDAAKLTDLLKKDYNAIDPDLRRTEISQDRTQVIAIFKSYLDTAQRRTLESPQYNSLAEQLKDKLQTYEQRKKELDGYIAKTAADEANRHALFTATENARRAYLDKKEEADLEELKTVQEQYKNNSLLYSIAGYFYKKYTGLQKNTIDGFASSNAVSGVQKSIPFIGGDLAFKTVIDELGRFLGNRLKEELTTYVIERVKTWLQNPNAKDPLAELKILLPQTTAYLLGFQADQLVNFPNSIKQYIEVDLNHLLENTGKLRTAPRIQALLASKPDLDFALEGLELIPGLSKQQDVTNYFSILQNSRNIARWKSDTSDVTKYNIANAIYLAGLLSNSLMIEDNGEKRFAGVDFLSSYATESSFYQLYTGFLYQQSTRYYNISFKTAAGEKVVFNEKFREKFIQSGTDFSQKQEFIKALITEAARNTEQVFTFATEIRKANKAGKTPGADTVYNFVKSIIAFSEQTAYAADTLAVLLEMTPERSKRILSYIRPYFAVARATNEIIFDLRNKRFTTALLKAVDISSQLTQDEQLSQIGSLVSSLDNNRGDIASWRNVAGRIADAGGDNITLKEDLRNTMSAMGLELNKIRLYYRTQYTDSPDSVFTARIALFRSLCAAPDTTRQLTPAMYADAAKLLQSDEFRQLVISYYSGNALEGVLNGLAEEMRTLYLKGKNGDTVRVIEDNEIDALKLHARTYASRLFDYYYISDKDKNSKAMEAARRQLEADISGYLALVPQRFNLQLNPRLISLIQFVNDMAIADNSEEMQKAIEAFALPAGSYAIKRSAKQNFSINSYPGLLASLEITSGERDGFSVGFTAPIGISTSWGYANGHSHGLFLSIIDIGAVTRLRLDGSKDTQTLPEINFSNILAPGLYFSYGFAKSPFSLNAGIQYGPQLRVIKADNTYDSFDSFRLGIGFVLDIPLLNLHTNPR